MSASRADVPPLLPDASPAQARAILGAMRAVAETGGSASADDRRAIESAGLFLFGHDGPVDAAALAPTAPAALAAALANSRGGTDLGREAVKFLTVMAFVDGRLDKAKIAAVLGYASALGIAEHYLDEIRQAAEDRLQEALADMTRCNMESIAGNAWTGGDVNAWLLPYTGAAEDPALAARFEALGAFPADSFGRAFWNQFKKNGYAFPGDPKGLNAVFTVPHDTVHVLTGYDTTPRGEILVSTFTAAMHPKWPMAGHVLPVILSWHLKVRINEVAGDAAGALDPREFWHAWAAGAAATVDTFTPDWNFWEHAGKPLRAVREQGAIPADGLVRDGPGGTDEMG